MHTSNQGKRGSTHLSEALEGDVAEGLLREQLEQDLDQVGVEDVGEGDPGQKGVQRGQRGPNQLRLLARVQHKQAQLVDQLELLVQRILQLLRLCLRAQNPVC